MKALSLLLLAACAACFVAACTSAVDERDGRSGPSRVVIDPAKNSPREAASTPPDFSARLLEIAGEYAKYTKRGDYPYWAPERCSAPFNPQPDSPMLSESKDDETHGRKLYFMYARDNAAYEKGGTQAIGQAFVKESFAPVEVARAHANSGDVTEKGGKFYQAGEKRELFIMFKLDPSTAGTHDGWVYGTVSADGRHVTSQGRVESCMGCHEDAPADHLFGPKGAAPKAR
jgi:Cytochrome P460